MAGGISKGFPPIKWNIELAYVTRAKGKPGIRKKGKKEERNVIYRGK
jgi:hypothetical protein